MISIALISVHATALSLLWFALLIGCGCFLIAVISGIVFGNRRYWLGALVLAAADLLLGTVIAVLDHMGLAR